MSILQNAVDSIVMGLEDFQSQDEKRILFCVRNFYAGVLLLFKYKLVKLSPLPRQPNTIPSLIKTQKGKGTINVYEIKERFKEFNIIVDWNRLERIQNYRNDIEHYFDTQNYNHDELRMIVLDIFLIVNKFIADYLNEQACDLFEEIKNGYNQFIELCINEKYGGDIHIAIKDGGDLPIIDCNECGEYAFLCDEGFCIYCSMYESSFCTDVINSDTNDINNMENIDWDHTWQTVDWDK